MNSSTRYLLLLVLLCLVGCKDVSQEKEQFIIGGEPVADISEIPWQVALIDPEYGWNQSFCGGSILNEQWILTAAHCFENINLAEAQLHVLSGTIDLTYEGSLSVVEKVYIHPQYNKDNLDNDIALLKLKDPLPLDKDRNSIAIPGAALYEDLNKEGTKVTVSGWGDTDPYASSPSQQLRQVNVFIKDHELCRNYYLSPSNNYSQVTPNMICAADIDKDACTGDSGGPLFIRTEEQPYLLGIVSWGVSCAEPYRFGVYTKTGNYVDWIALTIEEHQVVLAL